MMTKDILYNKFPRLHLWLSCVGDELCDISDVPLCIILNHWLLVFVTLPTVFLSCFLKYGCNTQSSCSPSFQSSRFGFLLHGNFFEDES